MHPLLWWYTTAFYVYILCQDALTQMQGNFMARLPEFVLLLSQVCLTLVLSVLSSIYPRDISLKRLNYVQFELEDDSLSLRLLPENTFT